MARIGGPFGFGTPGMAIQLAGGEAFYPPPGDYFITLGAQTIVQWWDQQNLIWRNLATGIASDPVDLSTDGFNLRLLNASGVVQGASITAAGSGAVNGIGAAATGVSVSFGAAPANGVAAAAYPIVGGQVPATITIGAGGSGFLYPPILLIDPPPAGGIQATATCTISAGAINAVTVTNQGAGYTSIPNIYILQQWATYPGIGTPVNPAGPPVNIIPPGLVNVPPTLPPGPWFPAINWGASVGGATLNFGAAPVLAGSGTLTGIVMTNYGLGYTGTTIPAITVTGAGAATATALMSMALQSITITSGGVAYAAATHIWESNLALLTAATGIINNNVAGPRSCKGRATQSGGVINATVIEDAGFGFQIVPTIGVIATQGTPPTTVANLTPVVGGVTDVSVIFPAYQQ